MRATVAVFLLLAAFVAESSALDTIYTALPLTAPQRATLVRRLEARWAGFQKKPAGMGVRELFSFSLESAEAGYKLDHMAGNLEKKTRLVCEGDELGAADLLLAVDRRTGAAKLCARWG